MMRKFLYLFILLATVCSCVDPEEFSNDNRGNFESLWQTMDEHYCFFSLKKQQLGVDWNEVHDRYSRQIDLLPSSRYTKTEALFEVLTNMVGELRDGHVNISSAFDYGRNWSWKEDYPTNFSDSLERRYLGRDYRIASGMRYRQLSDNIGYIRCPSFDTAIGDGNLDEILLYLATCNALIIDIRSNGGGMLTSAETLASRFTSEERLVGYMQHKTGRGHDDFSEMKEQRLSSGKGIHWNKPVAVLTNRGVYSAANEFAKYMRACGATLIGDQTGGGAGMPFSSELPNGWTIRFSACPMYDANGQSTEVGIVPDYKVAMDSNDFLRGEDTIIEYARAFLNGKNK